MAALEHGRPGWVAEVKSVAEPLRLKFSSQSCKSVPERNGHPKATYKLKVNRLFLVQSAQPREGRAGRKPMYAPTGGEVTHNSTAFKALVLPPESCPGGLNEWAKHLKRQSQLLVVVFERKQGRGVILDDVPHGECVDCGASTYLWCESRSDWHCTSCDADCP